ncbi:hypothetical protein ACKKBF_B03640 [Auxenochlorella protothecoides x Auxenochlorella symbiontica]
MRVLLFAALALAGFAAPASAAEAVPLPEDYTTACSRDVMWNITSSDHTCSETLTNYLDPVPSCCETLATYYGPKSTLPSRNCWCVPEYFAEQLALSVVHYISVPTYLAGCEKLGYPIYYYQEGAGPCAGVSAADGAATTGAASAPVEGLPMRSFGAWVRGLAQYKWGAVMFTVAILAAIGFSLMAWAFIFDAGVDIYEAIVARKNR